MSNLINTFGSVAQVTNSSSSLASKLQRPTTRINTSLNSIKSNEASYENSNSEFRRSATGLNNSINRVLGNDKTSTRSRASLPTENSIHDLYSRPDPQLLFDFKTSISNWGGAIQPNKLIEDIYVPIPYATNKGVFREGTKTYYPESFDVDSITLIMYEDVNMSTTKELRSWYAALRDSSTGAYALPNDIKRTITVDTMAPDGNGSFKPVYRMEILGVFPTSTEIYSWSSSSSARLRITQSLSVDDVIFYSL